MNSLRHKILLGYALIGALVIALSLFTFLELRLLEEKIGAGEKVGELFEVCLEIRRFEKNYFLYGQSADLEENPVEELAVSNGSVKFDYRPFEIITMVIE